MYLVRYLAKRLRSLAGRTVLHVGAHYGEEAALYERWGADQVIWIEADPAVAAGLRTHLSNHVRPPHNWLARRAGATQTRHTVIESLVGDEDGRATDFYIFSNAGASNSIFRKSEAFAEHDAVTETGEVKRLHMRTLDRLLPENGIALSDVDILVLDVQGAELLCLNGAAELLKSVQIIESEVSKRSFYKDGVLLPELDTHLRGAGFTRRTWVRRNSMNAVYTR
jgi:FkbM family methyltransferase